MSSGLYILVKFKLDAIMAGSKVSCRDEVISLHQSRESV
jgi:hypothetical protein